MFQILENLFTAVLIVNGVITLMLVALVMIVLHRQNRIFGILNEEEKSSSGMMTALMKKMNPFSSSPNDNPAVNRPAIEKYAAANAYRPPEKLKQQTPPAQEKEPKKVLTVGYPRSEKAAAVRDNNNAAEINRNAKKALENKSGSDAGNSEEPTAVSRQKTKQKVGSEDRNSDKSLKKSTARRKQTRKKSDKIKPMSKAEEQLMAAVKAG
ncbi:MAG: hypothetical protein GF307_07420 [candidate division Zixibacteria bacterium]|nr:hypothetical protein [candidate division Zixibacteria bacterium]